LKRRQRRRLNPTCRDPACLRGRASLHTIFPKSRRGVCAKSDPESRSRRRDRSRIGPTAITVASDSTSASIRVGRQLGGGTDWMGRMDGTDGWDGWMGRSGWLRQVRFGRQPPVDGTRQTRDLATGLGRPGSRRRSGSGQAEHRLELPGRGLLYSVRPDPGLSARHRGLGVDDARHQSVEPQVQPWASSCCSSSCKVR